jgi:hypothetical protein
MSRVEATLGLDLISCRFSSIGSLLRLTLGFGLLFGGAQQVFAQNKITLPKPQRVQVPVCIATCPPLVPYTTPDTIQVNLPGGALQLRTIIEISPAISPANPKDGGIYGETNQGDWATQLLANTFNLTPDRRELAALSQPLSFIYGEPLTDATWQYPFQPTRVKNSSIVFQVPISIMTSGMQWTGSGYTCNTGSTCTPPYVTDGYSGVYYARAEDCLSATDHPSAQLVTGGDGNPIPCNTADGILVDPSTPNGYWYDIAPAWSATSRLTTTNLSSGNPQTVNGTLSIPAQLPTPCNSIRIEFILGLQDQPDGGFTQMYWGNPNGPGLGPEYAMTRFAIQFPPITVVPAAFLQMNVLPYTIVYRPPGDMSSGTFTVTDSFGSSMTTGSNTTIDNSKGFEQSLGIQDDTKITALIFSIQQTDNQTETTTGSWDTNAVIGRGLMTSSSHSVMRSFTVGSGSPDANIFPASSYVVPNTCTGSNYTSAGCSVKPAETYDQQPFWEDRIVFLLHPQAALWDFNGTAGVQLLGASDFDSASVRDLDTCSHNSGQNAWHLSNGDWLTPLDCLQLVRLDPFYGAGQWIDPSFSGRGVFVGSGTYGRDPLNPSGTASVKFSDIFNYQTQQTTNGTATYNAGVTDVIGFSWSEGLNLGYQYSIGSGLNVGFSAGVTVNSGQKSTTGTSMKVQYTQSTIATDTHATEIDGVLADDHDFDTPDCQQNSGKCYQPKVRVFIDSLFGSYIFQDPDAACNVRSPGCRMSVIASVTH